MDIKYSIQDQLDWNQSETVEIQASGWKPITIRFIDSYPYLFWRINNIENNFLSNSEIVSRKGVIDFFTENLIMLKRRVLETMNDMEPERLEFYKKNIMELFDE